MFEVDITVIDILSIDENDLTFSLFFFMRIKYYHPDLFFHFLNSHYRNNSVPWMVTDQFLVPTPTVQLLYVKDNQHNEIKRKLFVKRLGQPYMNRSKEEYKGSENPLILESLNQANLICSLDNVVYYPFGEETCSFRMFLVNDLGHLKAGEISYQGKNILGQFDILEENWNLKCDETTKIEIMNCKECPKDQGCVVSIILQRDIKTVLIESFLPSLLMNIINQASVYLKGNKYSYSFK